MIVTKTQKIDIKFGQEESNLPFPYLNYDVLPLNYIRNQWNVTPK